MNPRFQLAVKNGVIADVATLLEDEPLHLITRTADGYSALQLAGREGHYSLLQYLFVHPAMINLEHDIDEHYRQTGFACLMRGQNILLANSKKMNQVSLEAYLHAIMYYKKITITTTLECLKLASCYYNIGYLYGKMPGQVYLALSNLQCARDTLFKNTDAKTSASGVKLLEAINEDLQVAILNAERFFMFQMRNGLLDSQRFSPLPPNITMHSFLQDFKKTFPHDQLLKEATVDRFEPEQSAIARQRSGFFGHELDPGVKEDGVEAGDDRPFRQRCVALPYIKS